MSTFEDAYRAKGVAFLTVNAFEPLEAGRAFVKETDLHYTWLRAEAEALEALGVRGVPAQIILDREGRVAWTSSFTSVAGGAEALREALDQVLARGS